MGRKILSRKLRQIKAGKVKQAPRWVDIKKFGLKRARTRRTAVSRRNWRRVKLKL
ncbi:MAG: 50S ribosomal protein L39e [Candidatus Aenigmarchaeota archaeon]|nr:50S ribosomal protein L39e [Candidatus Aenigmarchaeota archaeon]